MQHPGLEQDIAYSTYQRQEPRRSGEWLCYNASGEDIPPNSIAEVTGTCAADGSGTSGPFYKLEKPSDDSLGQVVIVESGIPDGKVGWATNQDTNGGLVIKYAGTAPAIGDSLGATSGGWEGTAGNSGFVVFEVDTERSLAFCGRAGGGGGSACPVKLVQVQLAHSGVASVKDIELKADLSDIPNYTTPGDAYDVPYLQG